MLRLLSCLAIILTLALSSSRGFAKDVAVGLTNEPLGTDYYQFVCGDHWFIAEGHFDLTFGSVVAHFDGDGIRNPFRRIGTIAEKAEEAISWNWSESEGGMRFEMRHGRIWYASLQSEGMWTVIGHCLIRETNR